MLNGHPASMTFVDHRPVPGHFGTLVVTPVERIVDDGCQRCDGGAVVGDVAVAHGQVGHWPKIGKIGVPHVPRPLRQWDAGGFRRVLGAVEQAQFDAGRIPREEGTIDALTIPVCAQRVRAAWPGAQSVRPDGGPVDLGNRIGLRARHVSVHA